MSRVLITRPFEDAKALQALLAKAGIQSEVQPLVEIVPGSELNQLPSLVEQADILIAVSKHAILQAASKLKHWPSAPTYLAVGLATRRHWQQLHQHPIICPEPQTSEGLLQLPELESVKSANILILRGQSGRELLAEELAQRGARVNYCECYQRLPIELQGQSCIQHWQQQQVSHWVATSAEQLNQVEQLCPVAEKGWLHQLKLITVSPRLAAQAQTLGFHHIELSQSANNADLLSTLKSTE